jgi:predicted TIM-barrel fold metal-dependent hydrolase
MAQQQTAESIHSLDELDVVVDCDSHVTEGYVQFDEILTYMENEVARDHIGQAARPTSTIYSKTNATPPWPDLLSDDGDYGLPRCTEASHKTEYMAEHDIDVSILGPTLNSGMPGVNNPRYAAALAQSYNSWLLDVFLDEENGLKGNVVVAPQKPDRAAEEIDRRGDEKDVVGVQLPATGLAPPPAHEWYDPIWQAAEDNDLAVCMHSLVNNAQLSFPVQRRWNETFSEDHVIAHPFSHMWNLTTMVFRGITEWFDVDVVLQEAGVAWVPYMKWRLDDQYLETSHELPYLDRLPSEYIDESYYFTTHPLGHTARDPRHMALAIECAGPGNIMFASDSPHPDFDLPEELFERVRSHFGRDDVEGMMGETAVKVLDI